MYEIALEVDDMSISLSRNEQYYFDSMNRNLLRSIVEADVKSRIYSNGRVRVRAVFSTLEFFNVVAIEKIPNCGSPLHVYDH